jgi:hypothetical protein
MIPGVISNFSHFIVMCFENAGVWAKSDEWIVLNVWIKVVLRIYAGADIFIVLHRSPSKRWIAGYSGNRLKVVSNQMSYMQIWFRASQLDQTRGGRLFRYPIGKWSILGKTICWNLDRVDFFKLRSCMRSKTHQFTRFRPYLVSTSLRQMMCTRKCSFRSRFQGIPKYSS